MKAVTAQQMREIDRVAIEQRGIPSLQLMERAGRAVAQEALARFRAESALVIAGKGNNGGDAFVAARILAQQDVHCRVILLGDAGELRGDALDNFNKLAAILSIEAETEWTLEPAGIERYDLVIDGLLGTGVRGAVGGEFARAIEAINASRAPILSIDIPSGLPSDGGAPEGACVRAAATVTMGLPKIGMLVQPGLQYTGATVIADLGFPRDMLEDTRLDANVFDEGEIGRMLPARAGDGHKGTFGTLLIVAGSPGMTGAAILAARAGVRSGAGLVHLCVAQGLEHYVEGAVVEAVKKYVLTRSPGRFDESALMEMLELAEAADAVALGPGLGQSPGMAQFVGAFVDGCAKPLVIDADGLNALAGNPNAFAKRRAPTIVTPHPGEMSRLTGKPTAAVQANRIEAARAFARDHKVTVVLKGAQSIVAEPGGRFAINGSGNSGMAKGGSGDVLTGLIGGLLAQGMEAWEAANAGTFVHGMAGDLAAREHGARAMTPSDSIAQLGRAFLSVEKAAREFG